MSLMYTRKANGTEVRLNFYPDKDEFVIYVGKLIYGVADTVMGAYELFNEAEGGKHVQREIRT